MKRFKRGKGQGLLEFALILPALLMIVLSIIEGALLLQAYLEIQQAAREATRWAVTYQPPQTYSEAQGKLLQQNDDPGAPLFPGETDAAWRARRVGMIKQEALDRALGTRIVYPALDETSFIGQYSKPGFFGVRVWGFPDATSPVEKDHPSLPGLPVRVIVYYRWEALDPLIRAIVPNGVMLTGEAVMINEGIQVGMGAVAPPTFPPPPTIEGATATPTGGTPVPTATETAVPTPTSSPTPSPTPSGAYVILTDDGGSEKLQWLVEDIPTPTGNAELRQHAGPKTYRFYWTDNCNKRTYLEITGTVAGAIGDDQAPMPDPASLGPTFDGYLSDQCGTIQEDRVYQTWLSTCDDSLDCSTASNDTATQMIPIYVPIKRPDLVVQRLVLPPSISGGVPFVLGVEIANLDVGPVSGTFDIDIYVDPAQGQVFKGQPGLGTAGGSSPKQWYVDLAPGQVVTVNYVVQLPPAGTYPFWAQVDTSDRISESDDENNIYGPRDVMVQCSNQCDSFDAPPVKPMWAQTEVGSAAGSFSVPGIVGMGELHLEGTGASIWTGTDGKFFLLNQVPQTSDFDMMDEVREFPRRAGGIAGLMVRESTATGARYAAIGVVNSNGSPYLEAFARTSGNAVPVSVSGPLGLLASLFDGNEGNGEGVYVRIERSGDDFTLYYSTDGQNWTQLGTTTISGFATSTVAGTFMAPR